MCVCACKPQTCRGGSVPLGPQEMWAGRMQTGCVCSGGAGCLWRAPLQALIICSTISAAPRLCSRACWYRSLCFSISFSWSRARPMVPSESRLPSEPSPHPPALSLTPVLPAPVTGSFLQLINLPYLLGLKSSICFWHLVQDGACAILTRAHTPSRGQWIKSGKSVNSNEEKGYVYYPLTEM